MPNITQVITAFMAHNWYAIAAFTLMVGVQIVRKNNLKIWLMVPSGYRFLWPAVAAMTAAFIHAFAAGEALKQALLDSLNAIWQIAIPAMGGAAALKESPLPWDGGAGGIPKSSGAVPAATSPASDDRPTPVDHPHSPPSELPPSDPPPPAAA
jgi:hypothetical protein